MKSKSSLLAVGAMLLAASAASANLTTLVSAGGGWDYAVVGTDLWTSWNSVNHASFDWAGASWSPGQAAFGNTVSSSYPLPYQTYWAANTDLALQTTCDISGTIKGDLMLNIASDNGFVVFVNGKEVAKANAEGYTKYWEYSLALAPSSFKQGSNLIQVLTEDHGGITFFDMQLTGNVVPAPAAFLLGSMGLGLVGWVKRRFA